MIVFDIETSGVDHVKCGIWQIGAIDFDNPERVFFEEARIDDDDIIFEKGKVKLFDIIGKTEEQLRDKTKQSQKQLIERFFKWCEKSKMKNFMCEGPQFDVAFLEIRALRYGLRFPFHYRSFDLHSIAQAKVLEVNGKFSIEKDHTSGLKQIIPFCGMIDDRKFHNALEDAKLTAECFSRVLKGKNLLKEFEKYPIPEYLKSSEEKVFSKNKGVKKVIIISGYFNPIHGGHLSNMKDAKKLGDELWVIVNNDKQQMLKKGMIILDEKERMEIVKELRCVDRVLLSIDTDESQAKTLEYIFKLNKNCEIIFAKGGDRNIDNIPESERQVCKKNGIRVVSNVGIDKVNSSSRITKLLWGKIK